MQSLSARYLDALAFTASGVSTLRALGEYRGKQELYARQRPQTLDALRTVAVIESTDASNRLEGITAPAARLEAIARHSTTPRNRSEQEIAGYRDALELIHQSQHEMAVTVNVVLQLHQTLHRYLPEEGGHWKTIDNEIVERDSSGQVVRVRFRALPAVATPQAMADLVSRYDQAVTSPHDRLVIIPLTILDFLCIHPFRDGNGRIARLLTLQLLYHAGYDVGRYISLETLFEASCESYYETLESSSKGWPQAKHDAMPWMTYFWGVLIKAYRTFEERVGRVGAGRGSKSQRVMDAVERKVLPFGIADLERECPDISRETIRLVLRQLKNEGRLTPISRGRGARWRRVGE